MKITALEPSSHGATRYGLPSAWNATDIESSMLQIRRPPEWILSRIRIRSARQSVDKSKLKSCQLSVVTG